jgi:hypothetical protein
VVENGIGVWSALRLEVRELIPRVVDPVLRFGQEARNPVPAGKLSLREFLKSDEYDTSFNPVRRF